MLDIDTILIKNIEKAIKQAFPEASMPAKEIILETPKLEEHGNISTNVAMRLSKVLKKPPVDIAEAIVKEIQRGIVKTPLSGKIARISVKHPGFINFFFTNFALYNVLSEIQSKGVKYGSCDFGKKRKVQVEFVSANPTGPLSVAHGRQAAVGDSLANILKFTGWKVTKEYFINDEGRQMNILGESIRQRYLELLGRQACFPEDGYKGKYIYDIAQTVIDKYGDKYAQAGDEALSFFRDYGCDFILNIIKEELKDFFVNFDVWTSQAKLVRANKIQKVFKLLEKKGFLYKQDDAVWFKSTVFGDDKDRVVVKSDGSFTYLAPDIAYHQDKLKRGFDRIINIWGPDHHGYIPRITAAVMALGYPKEKIAVLIVQLATLYKGQEQIPMSTRSGEFITLRQVINDVGKDAGRFFFAARKISSHLDFDIELAKKQSQENPVYYVQYAHARIANIVEFAKSKKNDLELLKMDLNLLKEPEELQLIKVLKEFPAVVISSAESLEPCGIVSYLQKLANAFHSFYDKHRVVSDDLGLTKARLVLIDSAKTVLATGLRLLGVSTPEKM